MPTYYFDEEQEQLLTNTIQFDIGKNIRENSELEIRGEMWWAAQKTNVRTYSE